jgi:glycosyltransferase involved in cell wall biosynthesis
VLSVIIPARNAAATLPTQLRALSAQTYRGPWEIIVADNGSTDGTREVVQHVSTTMTNLRWVDASRSRGTNVARNVGAAVARGGFLLFVDADDAVTPTWLATMAAAAESCAAVGGTLDRTRFLPARMLSPGAERSGLNTWPGFMSYPSGANCGLRASLLRELGGFSEQYSHGGDDAELFFRLQLQGHRVCFVPEAAVEYRERGTLWGVARQFYDYGFHDPQLYRDFAAFGMPRQSTSRAVRAWAHLIVLAPWYWWRPARRRQWARSMARRAGRVVASIRCRTIYL